MNSFSQFTRFAVFAAICVAGIHIAFYFMEQDRTLMALLPIVGVLCCAFYYLKLYTTIDSDADE
jgi:hypothetical protein